MKQQMSYWIKGMDCAEETSALRRTVGKLSGVDHLEFHLVEGRMTVHFVDAPVDAKVIQDAVRQAGLATLWMAIAADMGASLLVILNSLRLLRPQGLPGEKQTA